MRLKHKLLLMAFLAVVSGATAPTITKVLGFGHATAMAQDDQGEDNDDQGDDNDNQ